METPAITFAPPVIAVLSRDSSWWEKIGYQVNGLAVVFVALGLIWGVMEVIGFFFQLAARRAARVMPVAPTPVGEGLPVATVAAITAAVHATMGTAIQIRAIAIANPDAQWAREGRREVFQSHKLR